MHLESRRPRYTITLKFITYLMFLSVLPLLFSGFSSYRISRETVQDQASRYALRLLENQRDYLALQLDQIETLIANISGIDAIVEAMQIPDSSTDTYTNLATQARIGYILNNYFNLKGLVSIDIMTTGGSYYHVGDTLNVSAIRRELLDRWLQEAQADLRSVVWLGIEDNVNSHSFYRQVITAARVLKRVDRETLERRPIALLLVNYSVEQLYDQFSAIDLGPGSYLLLTDRKGRLLYHPDRARLGTVIEPQFLQMAQHDNDSTTLTIAGEPYAVSHVHLPRSDWTLIGVIPERTLTAQAEQIKRNTVLVLLLCFGLVAVVAVIYSRAVVRPIRAVTNSFQRYQANTLDLNTRMTVRSRDEIGELAQWFNAFMATLAAQRQSEAALRDSEERYSLAVRGANDGLWDWDLKRNSIYFSPRFKAMLGDDEQGLGSDPHCWLSRIHPRDRPQVEDAIAAHLAGHTTHFQCEYRVLHHSGAYIWVHGRGLAVRDADGVPYRMAGSNTDITDRKHAEDRLRHEALHDALTGLPNRNAVLGQLSKLIEQYKRHPELPYAVLFLDLDHFKVINDTQGHGSGDQLLIEVATRLQTVLRDSDTLARLGGDEFVVLLAAVTEPHAVPVVAERILAVLAQPYVSKGQDLPISASIGIAFATTGYDHPEQVLRDADIAMYRAKQAGKARFEIFDTEMREQVMARLTLETELRRALERQEFQLWYQPIVLLDSGKIHGFEALLRWQHPRHGLLTPAAFMSVLEDTGLIVAVGQWVLREACRQLAAWQAYSGQAALVININLSARQLQQKDLVAIVAALCQEFGLNPATLALEVTESALIHDTASAAVLLKQLKALGTEIHMDDFGTGYSSLSYLSLFHVDAIKIDRSFITDIGVEGRNHLLKLLVTLARELKIKAIAEGIEQPGQAVYLQALGCRYGQGYYFSKPLPPTAAQALLQGQRSLRDGLE